LNEPAFSCAVDFKAWLLGLPTHLVRISGHQYATGGLGALVTPSHYPEEIPTTC
jgi:hypothetical protein